MVSGYLSILDQGGETLASLSSGRESRLWSQHQEAITKRPSEDGSREREHVKDGHCITPSSGGAPALSLAQTQQVDLARPTSAFCPTHCSRCAVFFKFIKLTGWTQSGWPHSRECLCTVMYKLTVQTVWAREALHLNPNSSQDILWACGIPQPCPLRLKNLPEGMFLWLRLCLPMQESVGLIPGWVAKIAYVPWLKKNNT